jgi:hypothetical protein
VGIGSRASSNQSKAVRRQQQRREAAGGFVRWECPDTHARDRRMWHVESSSSQSGVSLRSMGSHPKKRADAGPPRRGGTAPPPPRAQTGCYSPCAGDNKSKQAHGEKKRRKCSHRLVQLDPRRSEDARPASWRWPPDRRSGDCRASCLFQCTTDLIRCPEC